MKFNINKIALIACTGVLAVFATSCDKFLDLKPVSQITPESYYNSADQLAAYLNAYYNSSLTAPFTGRMYHNGRWNDGLIKSDNNTDILAAGQTGNLQLFSDKHWQTPTGKVLQGEYGTVRIYNYFLEQTLPKLEAGTIKGDPVLINNYIGEAYFFRALRYYNLLAKYGDVPIVEHVLKNINEAVLEASARAPRNEVARFILKDLDEAAKLLCDRSMFKGQRINKEVALLFKSRVALFEATFEKYHKGSGRVPGDANWPGKDMEYNQGKKFDIDGEIKFFLKEAKDAAKQVADKAVLTTNSHEIQPKLGVISGWNPYFEMYGQLSLADNSEVLLWKQYDVSQDIGTTVPWRIIQGSNDGYTRAFTESFLMKNGLPIYDSASGYHGDVTIDDVKKDRDERLQLFVWGETNVLFTDKSYSDAGKLFEKPDLAGANAETRCVTGYQPRKYANFDASQFEGQDASLSSQACPIFRATEAMLNYMEANYLLDNSLDASSKKYWKQIRERAGVNSDFQKTIDHTDLAKEGDFGKYSGNSLVDKTLYNIRRERMHETFSEGFRFADLIRWRAFDHLMTSRWVPEGINYWDAAYENYKDEEDGSYPKADGSKDALISAKSLGKYIRPFAKVNGTELFDGYKWHEAYYLYPIGAQDITTASPDRLASSSLMYQNINWPTQGGRFCEK